jgi:hypothetical protein
MTELFAEAPKTMTESDIPWRCHECHGRLRPDDLHVDKATGEVEPTYVHDGFVFCGPCTFVRLFPPALPDRGWRHNSNATIENGVRAMEG